jgi:hypothetical protein
MHPVSSLPLPVKAIFRQTEATGAGKWKQMEAALGDEGTRKTCLSWSKSHKNLAKYNPLVRKLEFTAKKIDAEKNHAGYTGIKAKLYKILDKIYIVFQTKVSLPYFNRFDAFRLKREKPTNIIKAEVELFCNGAITAKELNAVLEKQLKSNSLNLKNCTFFNDGLESMASENSEDIKKFLLLQDNDGQHLLSSLLRTPNVNSSKIESLIKKLYSNDLKDLLVSQNKSGNPLIHNTQVLKLAVPRLLTDEFSGEDIVKLLLVPGSNGT